jgi:predicted ATPase
VTFLFSDVEGSTRLLHELGAERYAEVLATHRRVLREAFARHGGVEVDTQGDSFFVAFPTAPGAVAAAAEAQAVLASGPVRVRIGVHTGTPLVTAEGYVGADVNRAARIAAVAAGGQVLLSQATRDLVDADVRDLGEHRLKDLSRPERIFQLGDGEFPPLRSLFRTNLPVPATSFLGRQTEIGELVERLGRDSVRMLTLTGPGGTGKTRLALQVAAEASSNYPDGVFWVGLAALRDPRLVLSAIAASVETEQEASAYIAEKRMLLVLDNFEQVVEAAGDVAALSSACPQLDLLVTSRERLQVAGEHVFAVPPLEQRDAAALFLERAVAVGAEVRAANGEVAAICQRLDNLPLAIELAAARADVLSPVVLLERLNERLSLLATRARDVPTRQRTLRATIDWSYGLLTTREQQLFARIAVFAGGCTLEAAEQVCAADLDTLGLLADKSLLRHSDGRYWMLETIREYALERLHEREYHQLMQALAEDLLRRAEDVPYPQVLPDPAGPRRGLPDEAANFRSAAAWALAADDIERALRLAIAARRASAGGLRPAEQLRWLEAGLAASASVTPETRARALHAAGGLSYLLGEITRSIDLLLKSLDLFRRVGDERAAIETLVVLGNASASAGNDERALAYYDEAQESATRIAYTRGLYRALHGRGELEKQRGNFARASELLEESATLATKAGDRMLLPFIVGGLGELALAQDDLRHADAHLRNALRIADELDLGRALVFTVAGLAVVAAREHDVTRAGRLWGAVERLEQTTGTPLRGLEARFYNDIIASCRHESPILFAAAAEEGRRMSRDDACRYALDAG